MFKINKITIITTFLIIKLNMVTSNKYCSLQSVTGQSRYFMCGRHEYCCTFGCCVHLAFQFYQLWYYWLLLIFMFMVCSGGSWWYRFCRQNDSTGSIRSQLPGSDTGSYYGANHHLLHSTPTRSGNMQNGTRHSGLTPNDFERRVSTLRNNVGHSYYYRSGRSPTCYDTASVRYHSTSGSDRTLRRYQQQIPHSPHQTNFIPRQELCPYYQLYGPPPSYESVVQLSSDNSTTSCTLAEPITTIAPITNDETQTQNGNSTLVTPSTLSVLSSSRIIQPIVTVNLSNALSTSIEVRPISSTTGNLQLCKPQPQNHIEVLQQQQQQISDPLENFTVNGQSTTDPLTTEDPLSIDRRDDQKQIHRSPNNLTASSTTSTTSTNSIVPLQFRTNFIMRNEKNAIPSVCTSISTFTAQPKYCTGINNNEHLQQQQQKSTFSKEYDSTQCTCSIGSISPTMSTSSTINSKISLNDSLNKSKFLKSSKFNRKYYKKNSNSDIINNSSNNSSFNSNSSSGNSSSNSSCCHTTQTSFNSSSNISNNSFNRGTNFNRSGPAELINAPNSISNLDRSLIDNLVQSPNDVIRTSSTTTATTVPDTVTTTPPSVTVAIVKTSSKRN